MIARVESNPRFSIAQAALYSPESQIGTEPLTINWLNHMTTLTRYGLTNCRTGPGSQSVKRSSTDCRDWWNKDGRFPRPLPIRTTNDGQLSFLPSSNDSAAVVEELDLLLTAGRLNAHTTQLIVRAHAATLAKGDAESAFGDAA